MDEHPHSLFTRRATLPITMFVQVAASAAVIAPTVAAPLLVRRLHLAPAAVGFFIALVYLAAMFSSPIGAALVRRFGPIRSSQVALVISAAGLSLLASPWVPLAALGALLVGVGYGPITPASSQMLSSTTTPRYFALVFSIKQTGVPLGGVLAGLFVPPLVALGGGVAALAGTAALCLAGALSAVPLRRELDAGRDRANARPGWRQMTAPMRFVLGHPVLRSVAACSLVFSMVQVSLTSFLVTFLTSDLHWTLVAAGAALAVSQVGGVVGRIVWGLVADRWLGARRMMLALAGAMAGCAAAMLLLGGREPGLAALALLCLFGATAVGWNGVYLATVARLVPPQQAAAATAGTLFFTFFGVVIGPPLFGAAGSAFGSLGPAFALLVLPLAWTLWALWRADWSI